MEKSKITKKYTAEFIGIFAIVFCGTFAIIINQETSGGISHVGIAATFGLIIMIEWFVTVFGLATDAINARQSTFQIYALSRYVIK